MGIYFSLDESPIYTNKYILRVDMDKLPFPNGTSGAPAILPARLLNLSYSDYLRYTRDRLGAELIGKGKKYIGIYFDRTPVTAQFIKLLNSRVALILNKLQNPYDYSMEDNGTVTRTEIKIDESNT